MAWYYGTYSCGHDGRTNVIGPTKNRHWKIDREFSGFCPECNKKLQEERFHAENKAAEEKSVKMELPILTGTEKQVAWANTLRIKVIEKYEKSFLTANDSEREKAWFAMDYALKNHTDAKFWIESRYDSKIFQRFFKEYQKYEEKENIPEDIKEEIEQEKNSKIVMPDTDDKKKGIAIISFNREMSTILAKYPKNDKFIEIVKELEYKWDGCVWKKEITEYTGRADDRVAELGNKLLLAGFTVQFPNLESKEKAITADFLLENDRWVKFNTKTGKLALTWKKKSDTLYESAKKITGARWNNGSIKVSIEFYSEVIDFAETMGFLISKKAKSEIEKYKNKESNFEIVHIAACAKEKLSDEKRIEKSLRSSGTIIEDLFDD